MTKSIALITAALVAAGAPALRAQQHQHMGGGQHQMGPQSQMMMEQMGPGMALHAYRPAQLLDQRDTLGLTADQIAQLEAIGADVQKSRDQAMATHDEHRQQMMGALGDEQPDPETIQTHFMAAHAAMGMGHWAEMQGALKAMRVLTESQRAMLKASMPGGGMQHRHGQGGPGMGQR